MAAYQLSDSSIPIYRPLLPKADNIVRHLRELDSVRQYANRGPLTERLEQRLGRCLTSKADSVVLAASGTAALMAASLALAGRAERDRPFCLCPSYTFSASALAAQLCGYIPYLLDISTDDWSLSPAQVASHPELKRCGLVIAVAPFGRPMNVRPWDDLHRQTGVPVVIDAAASFEALSDAIDSPLVDTPVVLSLHATKPFACGEGGLVVSGNHALLSRIYAAMNFGFMGERETTLAGFNGKMSEYHAAVGLAELEGWPGKRAALRRVAERYRDGAFHRGLRLHAAPQIASNYALWEAPSVSSADAGRDALSRVRISHRLWYGHGLHRQPHFADSPRDELPVTDDLAPRLVGLPVAHDLSDAAINRVLDALASV